MNFLRDFFDSKVIAHKYNNEYCEDSEHGDFFSKTTEYFIPSENLIARFITSGPRKGEVYVMESDKATNQTYIPPVDCEVFTTRINKVTQVEVSKSFVEKIKHKKYLQEKSKETDKQLFSLNEL